MAGRRAGAGLGDSALAWPDDGPAAGEPAGRGRAAGGGAGRACLPARQNRCKGAKHVSDVIYVGLTIVVFAVLLLILKGVERFER